MKSVYGETVGKDSASNEKLERAEGDFVGIGEIDPAKNIYRVTFETTHMAFFKILDIIEEEFDAEILKSEIKRN